MQISTEEQTMTRENAAISHDERSFREQHDPNQHPRPSVAVDVAMLSAHQGDLWVLVIPRQAPPFKGYWGLPGGFINLDESLDQAATRLLEYETGLTDVYLEQLYTFGDPKRDPRSRVISIAYYALVDWRRLLHLDSLEPPALLKLRVPWEGEAGGPIEVLDPDGHLLRLAFDHTEVLGMAVKRIRGKLDYVPIGFQLLPPRFTLRQLQEIHETVLNRALNKDSFRRRMLASGLLEATGELEQDVDHRPAELYRFTKHSAI
jgi:8-oxo-dGTP diphosphatase